MNREWCLILGASSGMGKACARRLSTAGMNVLGVHLDPSERQPDVERLIEELRGNGAAASFFNENAANHAARRRMIDEMRELVGPPGVKVIVHSLSFGALLPFIPDRPDQEVITQKKMEMTLSVMAHSLVYWVQELLEAGLLSRGARIFALTSAGSTRVSKNYGAVSAAKCALESHVRQLAVELAPREIAVNAIRAGVTVTPSFLKIPEAEGLKERVERSHPYGRLTLPEDVADAIALLASASSSWVTGNIIGVDGGEILTV